MNAAGKLLKYMRPYAIFAIIGPILMCVEVAMDLLQPTIMQKMIDIGIANQDTGYIMKLGLIMLINAIIGVIGGIGSSIYASRAAANFAADVRQLVFQKTNDLSNRNIDNIGAGKLITIITNDVATIQQAVLMTLRVFVRGPLLFIGSIVIVWFTARELFPVLLVAIPILISCLYFFSVKSGQLYMKVQKAMDKVNTKLQEVLAGIRVIKAFDHKEFEHTQFKNVNNQLMRRNMSADQLIFTLMPLMMLVVNLTIVTGLWIGGQKVSSGTLQVGVILAFINYLNIMMMGLMASSNVLMLIARAMSSAGRVVEVLETEIDITDGKETIQQDTIQQELLQQEETFKELAQQGLEFRNVNFSYNKNCEYVLKDISFHAKYGQTIGIIGSTGSGKSTLIKLIPRLYDPDEGELILDGINLKDFSLAQLRQKIGFVSQKAMLFSGTIADNLRFGKDDAQTIEMDKAVNAAAASEFVDKLENKYDYQIMQGATNLSGGQKQRLAIARAFIRKPEILILDDATSAVDAISEAQIQQVLRTDYQDAIKFIISSKVSSVIDADQIIVMVDGRIETIGMHKELLETSKTYQAIYDSQLGREVV